MTENPKSILIAGESGSGKSASLMSLADREDVVYFNCENGKPLPFTSRFRKVVITDPEDLIEYISSMEQAEEDAEGSNPYSIAVIDTLSLLMDMFEITRVATAHNTQKAWGEYFRFFHRLMHQTARTPMMFVFLAHLEVYHDNEEQMNKSSVPVKGSLRAKGLEAFFTTVVYARKVKLRMLEELRETSPLLTITDRDRELKYKHVFQTDTDSATIGGRIRSPIGMWKPSERFINNDAQTVLERLNRYYNEKD